MKEINQLLKEMSANLDNVFFTSDTHFNHANIIRFCNRPFSCVEEMNETLVSKWNEEVADDSIVFHLGDFAFGGSPVWKEFTGRLKGKIVLIKGNHDRKNMQNSMDSLFYHVTNQLYLPIKDGPNIYLNHLPFLCFDGSFDNRTWQLYGHVHSGPYSTTGKDMPRLDITFTTQYDVGVDNNDFKPISYTEVKNIIESRLG